MNGSAARRPASKSSITTPRLRRGRDLPYLRLLSYATARTPLPEDPPPELLCLTFNSIEVPFILYHQVGPPGLLLTGELPRLYPPQRRLMHASFLHPHSPSLLRHHHSDGVVEILAPLGLEQQRYL